MPSTTSAAVPRGTLLELDAAHLWHPWSPARVGPDSTFVVSGSGCEVTDADGTTYLDAKSSGFNATLGYGCRPVIDAIATQLGRLMTYDLGEGSHPAAVELAARIAGITGPGLTRTFFCNSGSEAVEACVRTARFVQAVDGHEERTVVLSLRGSYHGSTMAAAACSPAPSPVSAEVAPAGFALVDGPATLPGADTGTAIAGLEQALVEHRGRVAAVLLEPVHARSAHVLPDEYLQAARELCDRHGALLVLDEVTTGFGRVGAMFSHVAAGVRPDIVASSKGLGAGYVSLGAVTTTQRVFGRFEENKARAGFVHGHTHSGHATACAAALAVIDVLEQEDVIENAVERGRELVDGLTSALGERVVEVRGRGLLVGLEFPDSRTAGHVRRTARELGVLVRRVGRTIIVAPPLIVSRAQVTRIVETLERALPRAHHADAA